MRTLVLLLSVFLLVTGSVLARSVPKDKRVLLQPIQPIDLCAQFPSLCITKRETSSVAKDKRVLVSYPDMCKMYPSLCVTQTSPFIDAISKRVAIMPVPQDCYNCFLSSSPCPLYCSII